MTTSKFINPFKLLKNKYDLFCDKTEFKFKYDLRNNRDAVKPFLDSLGCNYDIIEDEFIVVEFTEMLLHKLDKLKFQRLFDIAAPSSSFFKKLLNLTDSLFIGIYYQSEYNFEFYLIDKEDWVNIKTTKSILAKLNTKSRDYFTHFMFVYREILSK